MDSDLHDAVAALKTTFERRSIRCEFGKAPAEVLDQPRKLFKLPARYRAFLLESNPIRVETATPVERIRLLPAEELLREQVGFALHDDLTLIEANKDGGWRRTWVVIGQSALLGDPYFLDVAKLDAEGDCPVYTAMSGTDRWEPNLAASSFVQFLQILAAAMEVAEGFGQAEIGVDDEDVFREALAPKIRPIDLAALRAGHWT
ncbi:MAG TPA: SMI1/KNR4 family protein [Polyangiaceae bacterium]|nr:SMI1/KNR4 family protein [Polyangiaceae bacterium]